MSNKTGQVTRQRLVELWIEYMERLSEDARQLLSLKPNYFLAPRD